jgi:hypothetical protein
MRIETGLWGPYGRAMNLVKPVIRPFLVVLVLAAVFFALPAGAASRSWTPPPDTITRIEGNKADGFTVHHYDGTSISPPTDSEARAECSEYDRRVQRVRCRTEVRVWYDALGDTQRALRLAWHSRH